MTYKTTDTLAVANSLNDDDKEHHGLYHQSVSIFELEIFQELTFRTN